MNISMLSGENNPSNTSDAGLGLKQINGTSC